MPAGTFGSSNVPLLVIRISGRFSGLPFVPKIFADMVRSEPTFFIRSCIDEPFVESLLLVTTTVTLPCVVVPGAVPPLFCTGVRVTFTVYVLVVPSCAVTTTMIVFSPLVSVISGEALPLMTTSPLTVTVAVESATVGVTVTLLTELPTAAVYTVVVEAKPGCSVLPLSCKWLKSALLEGAR
ncbi:hypothetical protein D3C72_1330980 [compost metagenome]